MVCRPGFFIMGGVWRNPPLSFKITKSPQSEFPPSKFLFPPNRTLKSKKEKKKSLKF